MDTEVVMHTYNVILVIKRDTGESVLMRWMNLEPIIQSEVSQKEKNKYLILIHIYGTRKMVLMNLPAGQQWTHREDRLVDPGGEDSSPPYVK